MATICLRDVSKVYSEGAVTQAGGGHRRQIDSETSVTALNHVNLTISSGQTMAILGPSGCGKSTLLRIVAGLEADYTGYITTIYVTHDQEEAFTLGDQLAIMRQGQIEQVGLYTVLRRNPVNTFVAEFLGNPPMNLFSDGMGKTYKPNLTLT